MGEANQGKALQTKLSKLDDENPRNLLLRFSPEKLKQTQLLPNSEPQLDLSLRLSLGGGYSELFKEKPITRSSSVDGIITEKVNARESDSTLPGIFLSLQRSCSLPVDNVQGQIKLKDMQTKRRTEAQKRLVEKQRRGRAATEEAKPSAEATVPPPTPTSEVAAWAVASAARSPALCRAIIKIKTEGFVSGHRKLEDGDVAAANGAHSSHSLPNPMDTNPVVIPGATANGKSVELSKPKLENPTKKVRLSKGCYQDNGMDVMRQMPSVTTTGDGPNDTIFGSIAPLSQGTRSEVAQIGRGGKLVVCMLIRLASLKHLLAACLGRCHRTSAKKPQGWLYNYLIPPTH